MLDRILNTLRSRIWDMVFFLFSDYPNPQLVRMGIAQKSMVFIRMIISRKGYFLTRLYKNYIYLLLSYVWRIFLWLTLIAFWRIRFLFQQKSLICYSLSGTFIWMKTIDFWAIPSSSNLNTNFLLEPNSRKAEILYIIQCDVGASKNAGQAFSTKRLSSHCIIYKISAFRLFGPSN